MQILKNDAYSALELEELLKLLTITFEPPTVADLAVITAPRDHGRLMELLKKWNLDVANFEEPRILSVK